MTRLIVAVGLIYWVWPYLGLALTAILWIGVCFGMEWIKWKIKEHRGW